MCQQESRARSTCSNLSPVIFLFGASSGPFYVSFRCASALGKWGEGGNAGARKWRAHQGRAQATTRKRVCRAWIAGSRYSKGLRRRAQFVADGTVVAREQGRMIAEVARPNGLATPTLTANFALVWATGAWPIGATRRPWRGPAVELPGGGSGPPRARRCGLYVRLGTGRALGQRSGIGAATKGHLDFGWRAMRSTLELVTSANVRRRDEISGWHERRQYSIPFLPVSEVATTRDVGMRTDAEGEGSSGVRGGVEAAARASWDWAWGVIGDRTDGAADDAPRKGVTKADGRPVADPEECPGGGRVLRERPSSQVDMVRSSLVSEQEQSRQVAGGSPERIPRRRAGVDKEASCGGPGEMPPVENGRVPGRMSRAVTRQRDDEKPVRMHEGGRRLAVGGPSTMPGKGAGVGRSLDYGDPVIDSSSSGGAESSENFLSASVGRTGPGANATPRQQAGSRASDWVSGGSGTTLPPEREVREEEDSWCGARLENRRRDLRRRWRVSLAMDLDWLPISGRNCGTTRRRDDDEPGKNTLTQKRTRTGFWVPPLSK